MPTSANLRALREEKGWSQETLARLANVSVKTVARVENGLNPSIDTAIALSRALHVKLDRLVELEEPVA